jgi:hypothetical protein
LDGSKQRCEINGQIRRTLLTLLPEGH